MNAEWEQFLEAAPWFRKRDQTVEVGISRPPGAWVPTSPVFPRLFPPLATCLNRASVTPVAVAADRYLLLTWTRKRGGACAWLTPPPSAQPSASLCPDHRVLLGSFGGIAHRSNEPEDTWLLNHEAVLTESEAADDASFVAEYSWAFEEAGMAIPIELPRFYSIAREGNGNTTLCDRVTGEVVLFAPDHAFNHVIPYPGCPDYSLYRITGAATFREWVNAVADQWLAAVE